MNVEITTDILLDTSVLVILRVRFRDEVQYFFGTPWFTLKSGWL